MAAPTPNINPNINRDTTGPRRRRFSGFDYLALVGFSINMMVVAFIVSHWLSQ